MPLPSNLSRLPAPRAILLTSLLGIGLYCLYVGWNKSRSADSEADRTDVVETEEKAGLLPQSDEPLKPAETLALRVRVQDRFPLVKTVRQLLKQPSVTEGTSTTQSLLELVMSITVEEIRPVVDANSRAGVIRMGVRYHRIRFSQDLPGHEMEYDSDHPPARIPLELQAYHGLKNNGFQFWLGADNQIVEAVGFDKFLERCLQGVPAQHREHVKTVVESTSGTEGVANFIDQSIGVLPADSVREGASWTQQKKYLLPVPMRIRNQYILKKLTPDSAEVEILGSVDSGTNYVNHLRADQAAGARPGRASPQFEIDIRTGHTMGSYLIDRRTGLPRDSRVEQVLSMIVHLPGGQAVPQEKTTVTTIGYFTPDRSGAIMIGDQGGDDGRVQQAEGLRSVH